MWTARNVNLKSENSVYNKLTIQCNNDVKLLGFEKDFQSCSTQLELLRNLMIFSYGSFGIPRNFE